jgi:hypothetical protein
LTEAEGTAKQLGVQNPRHVKWRKWINDYNALIRKGKRQCEIAKMLGIKATTLSSRLRKVAPKVGMKVAASRQTITPSDPKEQPYIRRTSNAHGEGWGIRGCHCELCINAGRLKRKLANRRYRIKKKLQKQQG